MCSEEKKSVALRLVKEKLMKMAIQQSRYIKKTKWIKWLINKLRKKGYLVDLDICAYKNEQIVGKVIRYGGTYVFWSKACSGCSIGGELIRNYKKNKQLPQKLPCALLKTALISQKSVSEGEVILLPLLNR